MKKSKIAASAMLFTLMMSTSWMPMHGQTSQQAATVLRAGKYDQAIKMYDALIKSAPPKSQAAFEATFMRGLSLALAGRFPEADQAFLTVLNMVPVPLAQLGAQTPALVTPLYLSNIYLYGVMPQLFIPPGNCLRSNSSAV